MSTTKKNCLITGDSVSLGYTPFLAAALADICVVQHAPAGGDGGAEETAYGLGRASITSFQIQMAHSGPS
jgi:hypothetical protein